jgi:hypothetical protein
MSISETYERLREIVVGKQSLPSPTTSIMGLKIMLKAARCPLIP